MARAKLKDQEPSSRPFLPLCRVCGDQAAGYHYGVNTCEACKGFFHRSLRRYKEYTCRANRTSGYCEYKPGKRKSCQFCRYQRCLIAGMSKEAIKTGRYTYTKRMSDTKEIKRLQSLQHHFYCDFSESVSPASFMRGAPTEYKTEELPGNESNERSFVLVDTATKEEFERLLRSEYNHETRVYLPDNSPPWSSKSVLFESHNRSTSYMKNNSLCYNLEGTVRQCLPLSLENVKTSTKNWEIDSSSSPLSQFGTYFAENSRFARSNSNVLYNSDNVLSISKKRWHIPHGNLINSDYDRKRVRNSGICKPERVNKIKNVQTYIHRNARNRCDYTQNIKQAYLTMESPETEDNTSHSVESTSNHTTSTDMTDYVEVRSALLELTSRECESEKLSDSEFDLFPDISLNLNGQPPSSPSSFQTDNLETTVLGAVDQCSSLTNPCATSTHQRFGLSPAAAAFSMDSGNRQQCCHDVSVFQEPGARKQIHNCVQEATDKSVSPGMDLFTHCLDLSVDSRTCSQEPKLDQTVLIAPDSPSLASVTSSSTHPFDNEYLHTMAAASAPYIGVKDVQHFNISELYKDKDAVIAALMTSYKVNVEDYSHIPKDEMFAQQKAHYEECQLKKQTFGDLGFLPEHEYDEIYSVTGIDVDNRRTVIRKFLTKMEKDVRDLVQFAKSIPGFSYLDINLQMELVKLAHTECCMLSHYRTVNLELGIMVDLTGEHWACYYELGADDVQSVIADYVLFSDKLQKIAPTREEEVLLKAIVVVSTDGDKSVNSPLAEAIRWQLVMCLLHSLEKNREQPLLFLARYILVLTQSRTVFECIKDFLRKMKLRKYSSIEQNPLLWEICSWIVLEKRDDEPSQQQNTGHRGSSLDAQNSFTV